MHPDERAFREALEGRLNADPDLLTCSTGKFESAFTVYQYPARMIAPVQRVILAALLDSSEICSVYDPFMGSGTILTEAMYQGLDATGQDVNPLAVLITRAKASCTIGNAELRRSHERVMSRAEELGDSPIHDFRYREKWFRDDIARGLSTLRAAITEEPSQIRPFHWVALAETARLTSNSRTTTYKLHIRPDSAIENLPDPLDVYRSTASRNLELRAEFLHRLAEEGRLGDSGYVGQVGVRLEDSSRVSPPYAFDLLMTSPPYGDNTSTVPYGQASYLPLSWIDLADIDPAASPEHLASTYEIDKRSLGGVKKRGSLQEHYADLIAASRSLRAWLTLVADKPRDRRSRVLAHLDDLDGALDTSTSVLKNGGWMVLTVGNRRVGGHEVPLADFLEETAGRHGLRLVAKLYRNIPQKRMPWKNGVSRTMKQETILVMRKGARQ